MSGQHSAPDQWGRKTDADGDVIQMSGDLSEAKTVRPYIDTAKENTE